MASILDNIKYQLKQGGMYLTLLYINIGVFLLLQILTVIGELVLNNQVLSIPYSLLAVNTDLTSILYKPWTLITNSFVHVSFFHLLSNMLYLFFLGGMLEQYLGKKKILSLYLLGGLIGTVIQITAKHAFPLFQAMPDYYIIGASGAVFAISVALITYNPKLEVMIFGVIPAKLIYIVGLLFVLEFLRLSELDGVAHFAHVGGGVLGFLSMYYYKKGTDILRWIDNLQGVFSGNRSKKPKMKVKYSSFRESKKEEKPPRNDYDYNASKAAQQERLDKILDKIKHKGYDGLTKEEKEFLNKF
ncbi:MAG: rhomboid family intramembrane serine protease [Flavobacteriales bacterium]|nr:rhomboid family intramembrane serine protease [Flavobacteriales bacterium]